MLQVLPQLALRVVCRCNLYDSSTIQSEHHSGCALVVRTEMQQLTIATCFRVLVLCCFVTQTGQANSRADCFIACFIGSVSDCCFAWAIADCALHCPASQSAAFTVCALLPQLRCCSLHSSCFTSCFGSHQSWRAIQLTPANHHQ